MTELEGMLLSTVSYSLSLDGEVIFCRMCGRASANAEDVRNLYCGDCHLFHDNRKLEEWIARQIAEGGGESPREP